MNSRSAMTPQDLRAIRALETARIDRSHPDRGLLASLIRLADAEQPVLSEAQRLALWVLVDRHKYAIADSTVINDLCDRMRAEGYALAARTVARKWQDHAVFGDGGRPSRPGRVR